HEEDESDKLDSASWLEEREGQGDEQADDGAEVGDDVQQAEGEADEETEFQANDGKTGGEEHAHREPDEKLSAEERLDDGDEFAGEEYDIVADVRAEERQVFAEVAGRFAAGQQEEKQVDGDDREMGEERDDVEDPAEGGADRRHRVREQRLHFASEAVDDVAD